MYSTVPNLIICYQLGENEKREYITITTKNSASSYMMHGAKQMIIQDKYNYLESACEGESLTNFKVQIKIFIYGIVFTVTV